MNELWKDIEGYEGMYQVSNLGRIKNLERVIIRKNNTKYTQKEHIKKICVNKNGYYYVYLHNIGKVKNIQVHRIVAKAFIQNPNNLPEVNHKDENKSNNCVENLEWCTNIYNKNYGTGKIRAGEKHRKKVAQYSKNNECINIYNSGIEAEKNTNIDNGSISKCCNGKAKTAGGYIWRFIYE